MILDNKRYCIVGVMSGTSLDGLDLAACEFWQENRQYKFKIDFAETLPYPELLTKELVRAPSLSGYGLAKLNIEYGRFIGNSVKEFLLKTGFQADLISSHGHTVFHAPHNGLTLQIGSGAEIAVATGIKTVCDFRTKDIAHGGQGAPLVPIGDELLFKEYEACLNLGGFANISYNEKGRRVAFDICPVNIVLNHYAQKLGVAFDKNGELGSQGVVDEDLLRNLNNLKFYNSAPPKSLGREFVAAEVFPQIPEDLSIHDILRTFYEHASIQIATVLNYFPKGRIFFTGGGTKNMLLLELIANKTQADSVIPNSQLIDFKEALIFAFIGLLRINETPNCLSSSTGAKFDSVGGAVYL